jgi:hypothetical protein
MAATTNFGAMNGTLNMVSTCKDYNFCSMCSLCKHHCVANVSKMDEHFALMVECQLSMRSSWI